MTLNHRERRALQLAYAGHWEDIGYFATGVELKVGKKTLNGLVEKGLMERRGDREYRVTEYGRQVKAQDEADRQKVR